MALTSRIALPRVSTTSSYRISLPLPFPGLPPTKASDPVISPSAVVADGVSAILDISNRLGQAGVELGAGINEVVQQFFRNLPVPFWHQEDERRVAQLRLNLDSARRGEAVEMRCSTASATASGYEEIGLTAEQFGGGGFLEPLAKQREELMNRKMSRDLSLI